MPGSLGLTADVLCDIPSRVIACCPGRFSSYPESGSAGQQRPALFILSQSCSWLYSASALNSVVIAPNSYQTIVQVVDYISSFS